MAKELSPAKQRAMDQVDEWMERPPVKLRSWLKSEGLPEMLGPAIKKMDLERRLKKQGLWESAQQWKSEASRTLREKVCPGRAWNIANEICWRVLEDRMELSKRDILATKRSVGGSGKTEIPGVPEDILWVYLHKGLCADNTDPVVAPIVAQYEAENPCPHQGARNRYNYLQANPSKVNDFFAYVDKLSMEHAKGNIDSKPDDPMEDDAEVGAIADIERQIEQDMGAWAEPDEGD